MDLRRMPPCPTASSIHRRGSAYVIVLGASMFVMLTGMTALLAAQSQWRATENTVVTSQMRFGAQSAIELGRYLIEADPNWRNSYANDQWNTLTWDHGDLSWKVVDEIDGDLGDDATQPVRIWGRSTLGSGARLCSVQIETVQTGNLLDNSGFEAGDSPWTGYGSWGTSEIRIDVSDPQSGTSILLAELRHDQYAGPHYVVTPDMTNGGIYYTEVWVKGTDAFNQKIVGLMISSDSGLALYGTLFAWGGTNWQRLATTVSPIWSGQLYDVWWIVCSYGDVDDFYIDNAVLVEGTTPPTVATEPVAGSWRWETDN